MKKILKKIKSRGYWRINFRPLVYDNKIKELVECKNIVERNIVSLRGWNYPFFPPGTGEDMGVVCGQNFYEGWVNWWEHKEFWRLYQSGQFIHYVGLREDWYDESEWFKNLTQKINPGSSLGVTNTIYLITEIFEFLRRLVNNGLYDEGVKIIIGVFNTEGRKLWLEDESRIPFSRVYSTASSVLEYSNEFSKNRILMNSQNISLEVIKYFFDKFGWHHASIDVIKVDQEKLLSNKI